MSNKIQIAFDTWTPRKYAADQRVYQERLIAALPAHELKFSIARDTPQSVYMPEGISMASGVDAALAMKLAKAIWPTVANTDHRLYVHKLVQQFLLSTTRVPTEILDNSVVAESWPSEEKPHAAGFLHTRHASRSISMRG
ncbi:hypothetical protein B0G80_1201 [Paraburkholderia sp. BL6669N2]|uniref:hypothetical protein n=1 Tax=Paraburkholderia sp. BL6669N2 TaxID=1938807 RepID=UPI000E275A47|nr:hypothetical protein [Paraburkholderia sp. BL6669N2]REG58542.1 hypothetical protein B0G80_1201 [Paraburkholderia sp. BL6669N2]